MKILVTGSRDWSDPVLIREAVVATLAENSREEENSERHTLVHGAARGADMTADAVGKDLGMDIIQVPAKWAEWGIIAGPLRNQEMLDTHAPDMVLAFSDHFETSNGTKDMIRRAEKAGVKVVRYSHE